MAAVRDQSSQTFHGALPRVPQAVQLGPVAEGVHAHPEALVLEDAQLAVGGQVCSGFFSSSRSGSSSRYLSIISRLKAKNPPLTQPVARVGFSLNSVTTVAVDVHLAVAAGRVHAGDGAEPARRQVLLDQSGRCRPRRCRRRRSAGRCRCRCSRPRAGPGRRCRSAARSRRR